ncbi:GNAT family N-acetyltransferase [Halanaerobium congolense]|jgi:ElaA protein|uniref:ElaA protein n=1 Tax=Halanaerobium congolense TaxID=54121 RepID=A0A1G6KE33_9FIRM|nr:GNAT family N-acetyltransferase [Halanaerobium congolense]KXS49312.1 MAG: ElaA protein [Halanaerobium sp. T82-1]PXV66688.1 ElaA protein [Halanaerobium congolense]TDP12358.1 ElaA protein [Halanaerobium congolense]SDC29091.1 ElaA protein [Halanaerobium congolense]SDH15752.1 ElaA protein [Halanaerobium congolense]
MQLKIKKFNELSNLELYKIIEARVNIFVVEQNCPYKECDNKDQNSFHLYYEKDNEIITYLRIISAGISYPEISIGRVLVKPEYRKKGLAKKMMEKAISFIKENSDSKIIKISAQEYVLSLYQNLGFKIVSDRYLEDNIPHYKMIYKL